MREVDMIIEEAEQKLSALYKTPVKLVITQTPVKDTERHLRYVTLIVCNALSVDIGSIFGKCRRKPLVECRMFIMYYANTLYQIPKVNIGKFFGLDHTTVVHGIRRITDLMEVDDEIARSKKRLIDEEFKDTQFNHNKNQNDA